MLKLIFTILMGGIIGYVTNALAISMLFRPFRPLYIGKLHIPLTPGLIPKEQKRIASSVGKLIATELVSPEAIGEALSGEESRQKIDAFTLSLLEQAENCPQTLQKLGTEKISPDFPDKAEAVKQSVSQYLVKKLTEAQLGNALAAAMAERARDSLGKLYAPLRQGEGILSLYKGTLGKLVDRELEKNLPELTAGLVDKEGDKLLNTPLSVLVKERRQEAETLRSKLSALCFSAIQGALPLLVREADLAAVAEEKINGLDPKELEKLLRALMKKELSAIELLGALLGALLGVLTWGLNLLLP